MFGCIHMVFKKAIGFWGNKKMFEVTDIRKYNHCLLYTSYFKQDISDIHNELVELLQTVVISSTDDDVSEDALQLLCDYEWPPFEILEKNINRVSQRLKPDVLYAVNMDKEI